MLHKEVELVLCVDDIHDVHDFTGLDEEILEAPVTVTAVTVDTCAGGSDTLDKVLSVLGDMSEITHLLQVGFM